MAVVAIHCLNSLKLTDIYLQASKARVIEPTGRQLLKAVYNLSLSIGLPHTVVVEALFADSGGALYAATDTVYSFAHTLGLFLKYLHLLCIFQFAFSYIYILFYQIFVQFLSYFKIAGIIIFGI